VSQPRSGGRDGCRAAASETGLLQRDIAPLGAEGAPDPRVSQNAEVFYLEVQGLVRSLRDAEHRRPLPLAHAELQALRLDALSECLPPHEAGAQEADAGVGVSVPVPSRPKSFQLELPTFSEKFVLVSFPAWLDPPALRV